MGQVVAGPWGPVEWDPALPRSACRSLGCPVLVPIGKLSGRCHGCELHPPKYRRGRKPNPMMTDPELGPMRYCAGCDDWWPTDSTFWYRERRAGNTVYHCRGCRK